MSSTSASPLADIGISDTNEPFFEDHDTRPADNLTTADIDADLSDNDSILSDVDEAQFEDFDPANVAIDDRPAIAVDEDNVKLLGRHKRKRDGEYGDGEGSKKKKKEGKREKPKKARKKQDGDSDDDFSGGEELEGKRPRKKKAVATGESGARREKVRPRKATPEDEEVLDPEESRLYSLLRP